jgi:hypothetical protein
MKVAHTTPSQYLHAMALAMIRYHLTAILLAFSSGGTQYSLTLPPNLQTAQCAALTPHTLVSATRIIYPTIQTW